MQWQSNPCAEPTSTTRPTIKQGVKLYYQHKVTQTRPSPKNSGAVVKVTDLASGEDFKIATDKAVLNIPAEVGARAFVAVRWTGEEFIVSCLGNSRHGRGGHQWGTTRLALSSEFKSSTAGRHVITL